MMQLLPHGVPPRPRRSAPRISNPLSASNSGSGSGLMGGGGGNERNSGGGGGLLSSKLTLLILMVTTAIPSFFLGTLVSLYSGIANDCSNLQQQQFERGETTAEDNLQSETRQNLRVALESASSGGNNVAVPKFPIRLFAGGGEADSAEADEAKGGDAKCPQKIPPLFPGAAAGTSMKKFVVDMARTPKSEFVELMDPGVPLDKTNEDEVLLLYQNYATLPDQYQTSNTFGTLNPLLSTKEAVQNCDQINLVLVDHSGRRKQCLAIMPQYESYHVQRWMRLHPTLKKPSSGIGSLELVSRGLADTGKEHFDPPTMHETREHWVMLQRYFETLPEVTAEVGELLKQMTTSKTTNNSLKYGKTVIVMVCNFGQAELLMNFVCSCKSRGFDISNVLVFTTDEETTDLAKSLGLNVYFDHRNFGKMPEGAARRYGDTRFTAMMMAKVIVVQLVSMLGYDFLFQDVDIVWYKNPLDYFTDKKDSKVQSYDVFFQDDGGHSVRYAPYSANSGFYFVRHNERTRHFLTSLLMAGDIIVATHSHQQALIAVLAEHVSLYGLRTKVLSRDMEEFPGGYQFHQKSGQWMKAFFAGQLHPYIFHMSWTLNKDNKLLFFRQMGEWFVQDKCIQKKKSEIETAVGGGGAAAADLRGFCCSAEPLISCHYRDKPSKIPCKKSPPIDKGKRSFW